MIDWPGFLVPLWMALFFEPIRRDTIRNELKPISFEKKIEYVDVVCTIKVQQPTLILDDDGVKHTYETECNDILITTEKYNIGDTIIRRKKKGEHL
jgi:hypothetical protein